MEEEIEILKCIFLDDIIRVELDSTKPELEIVLYPPDTNENIDKKLLRLNLIVRFPKEYPNEVPEFEIKYPRGISDDDVSRIYQEINEIAQKSIGTQMLFEIFQFIKDHLADFGNVPKACTCAICLAGFEQIDKFIRLECYHYFHTDCMVRYFKYASFEIERERQEAFKNKIKWEERKINCPTCREPLKSNEINFLCELDKNHLVSTYDQHFITTISNKTRELQQKLKITFEKQKLLGGIIDSSEKKEEIIVLSRPNAQEDEKTDPIILQ